MRHFQGGVVIPLITPLKKNLEVDYEGLNWLVDHLAGKGVDAFFPISTTGEFPNLTAEEKINIVKNTLEHSGQIPVIAGISGTSVYDILELGKTFIEMGVEYLITTPPYYYKPSDKGLKDFFTKLLRELDAKILIYANPKFTGIDVSSRFLYELRSENDNLVGIKASVDSLQYFRRLIQEMKNEFKDFIILTGMDEYLLPILLLGGDGGVNALAHISTEIHIQLVKSVREGRLNTAISAYKKIMNLKRLYDISPSITSAIKASLNLMGYPIQKYVRPPLEPVNDETIYKIRNILKEVGLI